MTFDVTNFCRDNFIKMWDNLDPECEYFKTGFIDVLKIDDWTKDLECDRYIGVSNHVDDKNWQKFVDDIERRGQFMPVMLGKNNDELSIMQGRHRVLAEKQLIKEGKLPKDKQVFAIVLCQQKYDDYTRMKIELPVNLSYEYLGGLENPEAVKRSTENGHTEIIDEKTSGMLIKYHHMFATLVKRRIKDPSYMPSPDMNDPSISGKQLSL